MPFMEPQIYALSNSRIKTYNDCPKKAKYKFIDKLKEPSNQAMDRGINIHKDQENFLMSPDGTECPPTLLLIEGALEALRSAEGDLTAEHQVAFDIKWNEVEWFSSIAAMRVIWDAILDAGKLVKVVDLKTGKKYDSHAVEGERYALAAFHKFLEAEEVVVEYQYSDQGAIERWCFTREADFDLLTTAFDAEVAAIRADTIFAASPSYTCRWCHFRRSNGGGCEHG